MSSFSPDILIHGVDLELFFWLLARDRNAPLVILVFRVGFLQKDFVDRALAEILFVL